MYYPNNFNIMTNVLHLAQCIAIIRPCFSYPVLFHTLLCPCSAFYVWNLNLLDNSVLFLPRLVGYTAEKLLSVVPVSSYDYNTWAGMQAPGRYGG
jgi:hypothetical protein